MTPALRRATPFVCLLTLLALAGCGNMQARMETELGEEIGFAKELVAGFQSHDFEAVANRVDPGQDRDKLRSEYDKVVEFFPAAEPVAVETVGLSTFSSSQVKRTDLSFQYQYPDRWLLVSVRLERRDAGLVATGMNVQPMSSSLQELNRFSLAGKGAARWAMLVLAVSVPLLILFALVVCVLTPLARRKWAWFLFILFGLGKVAVNWTTGRFSVSPISVELLGAGIAKAGLYAPWIVSVSAPVGAVVFLLLRRKLERRPAAEIPAAAPDSWNPHEAGTAPLN